MPFGSSVTALIISNLYFSVQATSKIVCNFVSTFYSILLSREINLKAQSQYNVRAHERLPEKKLNFWKLTLMKSLFHLLYCRDTELFKISTLWWFSRESYKLLLRRLGFTFSTAADKLLFLLTDSQCLQLLQPLKRAFLCIPPEFLTACKIWRMVETFHFPRCLILTETCS